MSLKKMVGRMKLTKKKKVSPTPKLKSVNEKQAKLIVFSLICCLFFFTFFGFLQATRARKQVRALEDKVQAVSVEAKREDVAEEKETDLHSLEYFVQQFLKAYIPLSKEEDSQVKRLKLLEQYLAKTVVIPTDEFQGVTRKLSKVTIVRVVDQVDYKTVEVAIEYILVNPMITQKEVDGRIEEQVELKETTVQNFMKVDVVEEEGKFTVVSLPYFVSEESLIGHFKGFPGVENKKDIQDTSVKKAIQSFLLLFFDKYAKGSEDLHYLMKNVESLNGRFEFQSITKESIYELETTAEETQPIYIANVTVAFTDIDSDFKHYQTFVLTVLKENENFVVTKLEHFEKGE